MAQVVLAGAGDSFAKGRGAAAFAIGQLSEHCQPETGQQARSILPAVFALINDHNSDVQEQAYYALQTFCDSLGECQENYVGNLLLGFCSHARVLAEEACKNLTQKGPRLALMLHLQQRGCRKAGIHTLQ